MKFLIVSFACAPLNIISSQRINSLATYLVNQGHSVDILTAAKHPMDGPVDAIDEWEKLSSLTTIHEVGIPGRRYKVQKASDLQGSQSNFAKNSSHRSKLKNARTILVKFFGALLDYRTLWALNAAKYYKASMAHNHYDIMISSSGPACVNYIGAQIKNTSPEIRWIADFRDLWSLLHSSNATRLTRTIEKYLEKSLLRNASAITTVSTHLARQMESLHNKIPVHIIRNGFNSSEFEGLEADCKFFQSQDYSDKINIVYAGSINHSQRDPTPLIDSVAQSNLRGRIVIHFFGFNLGNLQERIKALSATDFCHIHPSLPRNRILRIQKAADINLILESGQDNARGVLTGKLFELVALGKPILSLGPPIHFESMQILSRTGLHISWEELRGNVSAIIENSKKCIPDKNYIGTLTRDNQFKLLENISHEIKIQGQK